MMMRRPVNVERAFSLFGLLLGTLPPVAIFIRLFSYGFTDERDLGYISDPDGLRPTLAEIERRYIFETLATVNQDKALAANVLDIDLSTLYRKLKRYDAI